MVPKAIIVSVKYSVSFVYFVTLHIWTPVDVLISTAVALCPFGSIDLIAYNKVTGCGMHSYGFSIEIFIFNHTKIEAELESGVGGRPRRGKG